VSAARVYEQLERDCPIGANVRVRLWAHRDGTPIRGARVAHPGVEVAWLEAGEAEYVIGSRSFIVHAGEAAVVPAGVEHATTFTPGTRATALWVSSELVAEMSDAVCRGGERLEAGLARCPASLPALVSALREELRVEAPGHLIAAESIAEAILVSILRAAPARHVHARARDPRVLAALDRMHSSYAEPLGVDDLARAAAMSRFHFSRLFREQVGEAPYRYLVGTRLDRAAELLRHGRHGATEAALAVGFTDPSRFARAFKARFGVLPSRLARPRAIPPVGRA
jgi:AraC-like DNA-binding protein